MAGAWGRGLALRATRGGDLANLLPGLALAAGLAAVSYALRDLSGLAFVSPLVLGVFLGMAARAAVAMPAVARPGLKFAARPVLRFAIVLLGLQITFGKVAEVGIDGFAVAALALVLTFLFTLWLGAKLGVGRELTQLIAAGTSICGASAIVATNSVARGTDEDVAYAMACVTLFGSLAMFLYPLLPPLLGLDAHAYGLWTGASVHEVAQVVAAAFQGGQEAGEVGTITKLTRVMLLAPMLLALAWSARFAVATERRTGPPVPLFVVAFLLVIAANSLGLVPASVAAVGAVVTPFLLAMSLSAIGLESDVRRLSAMGLRPLALGAVATLFISGTALLLVAVL
ncbi:YeiH family protein [Aquabacter spiritensis]|uniref:Putative integral membrane protein (TIGR00698 family) n=1 Tax=Aquabacter spiritensis TaxID=933073 RepID=A0A4R3M0L0_9HYPH|nr:putative sulfate exporter family transporter [Aquabacter spiritensis]TCT06116.1 putative integral membrane protein (TIGR00698 family) [Aquabacter spiritensis]